MDPERVSDPFGYWKCGDSQNSSNLYFFFRPDPYFFLEFKTVLSGNAVLNLEKVRIPPPHPYLAPVSRNRLYFRTAFSGNTVLN